MIKERSPPSVFISSRRLAAAADRIDRWIPRHVVPCPPSKQGQSGSEQLKTRQ